MSELAERYRIFSGLLFIDIDDQINRCKPENLPFLYRKLIWNIQRGLRLSIESRLGKEFAWIVCNLALRCNINPEQEDIIPDGLNNYDDWRTHLDLEFAHQIIKDCEHIDKIISYLLIDPDEENLIIDDGEIKIVLD